METLSRSLRLIEALLFAAAEPLDEDTLARHLPEEEDLATVMTELAALYQGRGVELVRVAGRWAFRTAPDMPPLLVEEREQTRQLSRAAVETLAIIAYHQPVTRAEIEEIRGVSLSRGTLDILLEAGWVRPRGRRRTPGRPLTYGTTDEFLIHFGLDSLQDLPGIEELKAAGLMGGGRDDMPGLFTALQADGDEGRAHGEKSDPDDPDNPDSDSGDKARA